MTPGHDLNSVAFRLLLTTDLVYSFVTRSIGLFVSRPSSPRPLSLSSLLTRSRPPPPSSCSRISCLHCRQPSSRLAPCPCRHRCSVKLPGHGGVSMRVGGGAARCRGGLIVVAGGSTVVELPYVDSGLIDDQAPLVSCVHPAARVCLSPTQDASELSTSAQTLAATMTLGRNDRMSLVCTWSH